MLATMASAGAATAPADVRLRVVFYPAIGLPIPAGDPNAALTTTNIGDELLTPLSNTIKTTHTLYDACVYDLAAAVSTSCDPTSAAILVTTQFSAESKPTDPAKPRLLVTMRAFDMINARTMATLSLQPIDASGLKQGDATNIATALKQIAPTSDQLSLLLGTPSVTSGQLSLFQG